MSIFLRLGILMPLLFMFYGCATIKPLSDSARVTKHIYNKNYRIGTPRSAYVGEEIIKVVDYYAVSKKTNKIKALNDFTVSVSANGSYHANKGEVFNILGVVDENGFSQYVIMFPGIKSQIKFCINSDGTISNRLIGDMNQTLWLSPKVSPSNAKLEVVSIEEIDTSKGYINFELVYSGITGNNINILYREYTREGLAREAYYQNITYPINSKTIRFRNILLLINSLTAEQISYTVTQDGLPDNINYQNR